MMAEVVICGANGNRRVFYVDALDHNVAIDLPRITVILHVDTISARFRVNVSNRDVFGAVRHLRRTT